jgi:two-component system, OmpR family, phosphate regulon sensor histidine kinase PhoR
MSTQFQEKVLLVISENQITFLMERMLKSMGYAVETSPSRESALETLKSSKPSLAILAETLPDITGLDFAAELAHAHASLPLILLVNQESPATLKTAMRLGITEYLCLPLRSEDIMRAVKSSLEMARLRRDAVLSETRRSTSELERRLDELEALTRLGKTVTGSLDLDHVLTLIVDAAVELTASEEGSLLLLDEETGELYMRAARNFQEEFVRTFRLPVNDTLAGSVIRNGQAVLLDDNTPQKIKTSYLVQSLLYVPLAINGHVFGVLGIDNRKNRLPFTSHHVKLLSALAEFAVIAIENARLYADNINERRKMETVLTDVRDGVILLDQDQRLLLVNHVVRQAVGLNDANISGRPFRDIFAQPVLNELLDTLGRSASNRTEMMVEDGRVFSVQISPIPSVGVVFTLSDITSLKKLDQIKSDFVHTVSHDLRSPLTAILGYVELIDRAGPVNEMQRDFIRRVQVSVHNITSLVDELLDLGRIEAGFDTRKDSVQLEQIIYYSADGMKKQLGEKGHHLQVNLPSQMPVLLANPVQLRQLVDNLLDNAIKYTPAGGTISISGQVEQNQIILQVMDNGIGIPTLDLPYIFDKFYRASNANTDLSGSGLGLAIVKSISESHGGRVWVDSTVGKGTIFTVVLPLRGG